MGVRRLVIALVLLATAPASAGSGSALVLRWEAVPGAKEYVLEIAEDPGFERIVKRERVPHAAYRFVPPSTEISYFFRVAAVDDVGRTGRFSSAKPIQQVLTAPTLAAPADGATIDHVGPQPFVKLQWKPVPDADSYRVSIGTSRDLEEATVRTVTETSTTYRPAGLETYFWRVVALDKTGLAGRLSQVRRFEVRLGAPQPSRPRSGALVAFEAPVTRVTLRWSAGPADRFEIQTAADARFRRAETITSKRTSSTLEIPEPRTIFWRVRGIRADEPGPWSAGMQFAVQAASIVLETPAADAEVGTTTDATTVELRWSAVDEARSYLVTIDTSGADEPVEVKTAKASASVELPTASHTWSVNAYDARRRLLAFSAERAFTVSKRLAAPTLTAPAPDESFLLRAPGRPEIELAWEPVEGATGYDVEIGATAALDAAERQIATSERITLWVARAGETFWRVRATGNGTWSEVRKLSIAPRARSVTVAAAPATAGVSLVVSVVAENGEKLAGIPLQGSATAGALSGFDDRGDGTYTATWSGADAATVSVTGPFGLSTSTEVAHEPGVLFAGVSVGVLTNFTADASPRFLVRAAYLLPLLERRLFVTGTAGYAWSGKSFEDVVEVGANLHRFPMTVGGGYRHPFPWLEAYGTVGLALDPFVGTVTVDGTAFESESGVVVGVDVAGGATWQLGPGRLSAEIALRATSSWDGLFALGGAAAVLAVGYSLPVL